jgi:hypothetical protein
MEGPAVDTQLNFGPLLDLPISMQEPCWRLLARNGEPNLISRNLPRVQRGSL